MRQEIVEQEHVVAVVLNVGLLFLDDQRPHEATVKLKADVRVIDVGSRRVSNIVVDELFPRFDRPLGQTGHAIHRIRHRHTVPVNRRFFRQFIAQNDVEPVALIDANLGARELSV